MMEIDEHHSSSLIQTATLGANLLTNSMEWKINAGRYISEMQDEFSSWFPFLKIEFINAWNANPEEDSQQNFVQRNITLGEVSPLKAGSHITITEIKKLAELEEEVEQKLGLKARVFRKMGNVWIRPRLTYDWTLGMQNQIGSENSGGA